MMAKVSNAQLMALNALQAALPKVQKRLDHWENNLTHVGMLTLHRQTHWERSHGIQIVRIKAAYPYRDEMIRFKAVVTLRVHQKTCGYTLHQPHKVNFLFEGASSGHFEVMHDASNQRWYTGGPMWTDEFPWDSC